MLGCAFFMVTSEVKTNGRNRCIIIRIPYPFESGAVGAFSGFTNASLFCFRWLYVYLVFCKRIPPSLIFYFSFSKAKINKKFDSYQQRRENRLREKKDKFQDTVDHDKTSRIKQAANVLSDIVGKAISDKMGPRKEDLKDLNVSFSQQFLGDLSFVRNRMIFLLDNTRSSTNDNFT